MPKGMSISAALQQLGLTNEATEKEVKQAYKDLARIWHPDRFQNDERLGARTEAQIKVINEARTVAVTYLEKHGHFLHVGREQQKQSQSRARYRPSNQEREPFQKKKQERPKPAEPDQKEKAPKPKQAKQEKPITPDVDSSFHIDQGSLVIVFVLLLLVSFLFMLGSSLINPPEEKLKSLTRKIILTNEKSDLRKEWEVRRAKEKVNQIVEAVIPLEKTVADTFFTLGSDKAWVSEVQGPPNQIKGGEWHYEYSTISFGGGKVIGWNSSTTTPLKTGMPLDSIWLFPNPYFKIGSFREEVIALQGVPDVIDGDLWTYGKATVEFSADTVAFWENDHQNILKAR